MKSRTGSIAVFGLALALLGQSAATAAYQTAPQTASVQAASADQISAYQIKLGMTSAQVAAVLGQPARKDPSHTGVVWWIYNKDLNNYLQVGIQNDKVVTLFTNGANASFKGVKIGSTTTALSQAWGTPKSTLAVTPYLSIRNNTIDHPTYLANNQVYTFSIDKLGGNKISGVRISTPDHFASIALGLMYPISYSKLPALPTLTSAQSQQVALAYEKQNFDLTNSARKRAQLPLLSWDAQVAAVARSHSADMAVNNYFSHTSPSTGSPFDRLEEAGISFWYAGENIAYGQLDGVEVHMGWMNSAGHRKNLLNANFKQIGIGVVAQSGKRFYTQNFVTRQ